MLFVRWRVDFWHAIWRFWSFHLNKCRYWWILDRSRPSFQILPFQYFGLIWCWDGNDIEVKCCFLPAQANAIEFHVCLAFSLEEAAWNASCQNWQFSTWHFAVGFFFWLICFRDCVISRMQWLTAESRNSVFLFGAEQMLFRCCFQTNNSTDILTFPFQRTVQTPLKRYSYVDWGGGVLALLSKIFWTPHQRVTDRLCCFHCVFVLKDIYVSCGHLTTLVVSVLYALFLFLVTKACCYPGQASRSHRRDSNLGSGQLDTRVLLRKVRQGESDNEGGGCK